MKSKLTGKLVVAFLYGIMALMQVVFMIIDSSVGGASGVAFALAGTFPLLVSMPLFALALVDIILLIRTIEGMNPARVVAYKKNYNVVLCILLCLIGAIFGLVSIVDGMGGFILGMIAGNRIDGLILKMAGIFYLVFAPVILLGLFIAEIVTSALVGGCDEF